MDQKLPPGSSALVPIRGSGATHHAPTGKLVKETIEKLGGGALKGLVLDLRDNPGGAVEAAIETASLFLKPEQLIFSAKGRTAKTEEVRVPKDSRPYVFPVAALTVQVNDADPAAPVVSVAVTLTVEVPVAVGVPVIRPVPELMDTPVG